jgi:2-C-methyl-D-erythritol 2,4-cyclodiphosphate synthase
MRIGHGFDTHHFVPNHPLWLGGILIPHHSGLHSHSDGDVVIHALCDALLGALALGDIGQHFPPNDPKYKNQASSVFLETVMTMLQQQQYIIANIDITIIAEEPKLAPHIPHMRETLSLLTKTALTQLSVKASTSDHMGFTGRKEGVVAFAVVLLTAKNQVFTS